jgi:GNAT superfamily N-acetyltransferase
MTLEEDGDDGFELDVTTRHDARLIEEFYQHYATAFVLPDERESLPGFRRCLALNHAAGDTLHARYGPSREFIAVMRDRRGQVVAGLNFICFPMPEFADTLSVHSIYVFVVPAWRGRGLLRRIYQRMDRLGRAYGVEHGLTPGAALVFIGEQNDPFRMTLDAFRTDTEATGLNQFDRMARWGRLGARVLDFNYVQPALSDESAPDRTLFLRALFRDEERAGERPPVRELDPGVLREHLSRFFAITVLKGEREPDRQPEILTQMAVLDEAAATGRSILARAMPRPEILDLWKGQSADLLRGSGHPGDTVIGPLLGIASTPEALLMDKFA